VEVANSWTFGELSKGHAYGNRYLLCHFIRRCDLDILELPSLSLFLCELVTLVTFFSLVADEGFVIDDSLLLASALRAISAVFAAFLSSF